VKNPLSPEAKADLDPLFEHAMNFAGQMLSEHGEFHPFGVFARPGGEILELICEGAEGKPSVEQIDELVAGVRSERAGDGVLAFALAYDVRTADGKQNAVCVDLEHSKAEALRLLVPYQLGKKNEPSFGEIGGHAIPPRLFSTAK
jgi:hypothetical protein